VAREVSEVLSAALGERTSIDREERRMDCVSKTAAEAEEAAGDVSEVIIYRGDDRIDVISKLELGIVLADGAIVVAIENIGRKAVGED